MTSTSTSDPLVGHVLEGRYEIVSRLARGGMATVYRAHDRRLQRMVAIKVMHDGLGDHAEFSRKFDREARAAAVVTNPHVVSVFDQGRDGERPYIVMEYVEGCTLRHVITREAPLTPLRALDLLEPVASALASAHEAGIVHRDVKPENVLLSTRGHVKVTDFGLARAVSSQTATATQGMLMGTVSYLAPELVTVGRTDSRGDVYSTGVMLFEMLTGRKPHTGDVPIQVAYMHVHSDIPAPSTVVEPAPGRQPIPQYLDALVQACTRRDPAERPTDARELLQLLRSARRAVASGIEDDPALTRAMWASVTRAARRPSFTGTPQSAHLSGAGRPTAAAQPATMPQAPGAAPSGMQATPNGQRPAEPAPAGNPGQQAGAWNQARSPHGTGHVPIDRVPTDRMSTDRMPTDRMPTGRAAMGRITGNAHAAHRPSGDMSGRMARGGAHPAMPRPAMSRTVRARRDAGRLAARRRRGIVVLLGLLLLVLLLLFGVHSCAAAAGVSEPAITNLRQHDAEQALLASGLGITVRHEYSDAVASGLVTRTEPTAGSRLPRHSTVEAWVSLGVERRRVPSLVGLPRDVATRALASAHLATGTVRKQYSQSVSTGTVLAASQAPGTLLRHGSRVDLTVSLGRRPVVLADLAGTPADSATTTLHRQGLAVGTSQQDSDTVAAGLVIRQTPGPGTVHAGDTVSLVVSNGPAQVSVPDVRLKDEADARQVLTDAGFQVSVSHAGPSWLHFDLVTGQTPRGGTRHPRPRPRTARASPLACRAARMPVRARWSPCAHPRMSAHPLPSTHAWGPQEFVLIPRKSRQFSPLISI